MDAFQQSEALVQARMTIAVHEEQIAGLRTDMADMKEALDGVQAVLQQMQNTLAEARGGWKTLMLMGGAGASVWAGLTWLIDHFAKRG